jgi:tetratricopeptide (TPR) repeat protein
MADQLVQTAPKNKMSWYARGCVNMNTFKKYAEAREDFDKAIALDENFVEALYNKGVSYVNELISLHLTTDTKSKDYQKTLEQARTYYKEAQPLFEKVRELAPSRKDLWAENLRSIYYNLDMKDKAKEMETILNTK